MVLTDREKKKILNFVKKEPRTIQDIAKLVDKCWVTADSYVKKIRDKTGLINIKKFRGGTRGALKIVYWNYAETVQNISLMKNLFERIRSGRRKRDFSPFDIYQFVKKEKKRAFTEEYDDPLVSKKQNITNFLRQTEKTLYCFSGNLSWTNMTENGKEIIDAIEYLCENNVAIKVLSRVDFTSLKNIDRIKKIDKKLGKDLIEIRHCRQPLRGFIIDDKVLRLKEIEKSDFYKRGELKKDIRVFYEIYDYEWIDWLQKVFWNLYRHSIPAERRIKQLEVIF